MTSTIPAPALRAILMDRRAQMEEVIREGFGGERAQGALAAYRAIIADVEYLAADQAAPEADILDCDAARAIGIRPHPAFTAKGPLLVEQPVDIRDMQISFGRK